MPELNPYEAPQEDLNHASERGVLHGAGVKKHLQLILFTLMTETFFLWLSLNIIQKMGGFRPDLDLTRSPLLLIMLGGLAIGIITMLVLAIRFCSPGLLVAQLLLLGFPLLYVFALGLDKN
jgi:uncharacterized membrane protein